MAAFETSAITQFTKLFFMFEKSTYGIQKVFSDLLIHEVF